MGSAALILLLVCGVAFAVGGMALSWAIAKSTKNKVKEEPYECVFMYPWAVAVKKVGMPGLIEIVVFMFILFMGLLYAWKKGALKWM
jgi:NADH:ubiquinone oxidoreductase subunit 3 (subunit A)